MTKWIMIIAGLSLMLIVGWITMYASHVDAGEPDSFRTVTLEIEGMT